MTLEEALQSRWPLQQAFETMLAQKVKQIKTHYDNPKLNEKQLHFLKKDEDFCKTAEEFANKLIAQINFLIHENKQQQQMMSELATDIEKKQQDWINLCLEFNDLRFEKMEREGTKRFSFKDGLKA